MKDETLSGHFPLILKVTYMCVFSNTKKEMNVSEEEGE